MKNVFLLLFILFNFQIFAQQINDFTISKDGVTISDTDFPFNTLFTNDCGDMEVEVETTEFTVNAWRTLTLRVFRDGVQVAEEEETFIGIPAFTTFHTFTLNVPSASGVYTVTLDDIPSGPINVNGIEPEASFVLNGAGGTSSSNFCPGETIFLDGSNSTCEDSYFIAVQESNIYWENIGPEVSQWFNGSAPSNFNISSFAQNNGLNFQVGKYYRIKLAIGPTWSEQVRLVYIQPANAAASLENIHETEQVITSHGVVDVDVFCSKNIIMNGAASTCEDRYSIIIEEWDLATGPVVGTKYIMPWEFNEVPNGINLSDLYAQAGMSMAQNKVYKVQLAVGLPWDDVYFFVKRKICRAGDDKKDRPGRNAMVNNDFSLDKNAVQNNVFTNENLKVYPNPFNAQTNISFSLSKESKVSVQIYSMQGALVKTLMNNDTMAAGIHEMTFDATDLSVGSYLCMVKVDDQIKTQVIQLIRD